MAAAIDKITIKGYKSIRELIDFPLGEINILIGANGSGKSNFVGYFTLLREMIEGRLESAVNLAGRADKLLFFGPKYTKIIESRIDFGQNAYAFALAPTVDNRLIFEYERMKFIPPGKSFEYDRFLGKGHGESHLKKQLNLEDPDRKIADYIFKSISSWTVYHFHDTSDTSAMRRSCSIRDYDRLRSDASNLAAFLNHLTNKYPSEYRLIVETVRLAAPFFKDFMFRPQKTGDDVLVDLEWTQKNGDYPFHASQLSDGTLRFIALAAALLQPDPPSMIVIDEPELGLHPEALDILASLMTQTRKKTQLIVSTQSAALVDAFDPENVIVVDRHEGESRFRRLDSSELDEWLKDDYSLGDLWRKNVFGGGPVYE